MSENTASVSTTPRPVMLVILDGFGWREDGADNAVQQARTPVFDRLWSTSPHTFLRTCGEDVGLPDGQMGNSEVGHMNIGAGRVVMQELPRIGRAILDGSLKNNPALRDFIEALKASGGTCHLMGLMSPGGVHSHQDHAIALARIVTGAGVPVALHLFTDGRDTPPQSAPDYLAAVEAELPDTVKITTVSGRYFAMDRDNRWDRVARAWNAIVTATGHHAASAAEAIRQAHAQNVTDEFIEPAVIGDYHGARDGDGILSFNFRSDRIRELLTALIDPSFTGFDRPVCPKFVSTLTMTRYSTELEKLTTVLFPPEPMTELLGDVVSAAGRKQLRMAETEKYPHVTYFLNGGREEQLPGEDRILVPSPAVATYDLQPEMSAEQLTDRAVEAIGSGTYDLIVLNYANPDMVGHTGILEAAVKAVEAVDTGLGRVAQAVEKQGGTLLVTADHGNCEMMRDPETKGPHTAHTLNEVPCVLAGAGSVTLQNGRLADIAPTLLGLMKLPQPEAMTGKSLISVAGA